MLTTQFVAAEQSYMLTTSVLGPGEQELEVGGMAQRLASFFFGGRPIFLRPSKLEKKQTDGEQREDLLLTTQ
jgi:hypothetical protein